MQESARGNLWMRLSDGRALTIFPDRRFAGYKWCVAGDGDLRYSQKRFDTEQDAAAALLEEIAYA
jgi:hypothetical protein